GAVAKHVQAQNGRPKNIVVVDDDHNTLDLMGDILGSAGYVAHLAPNGNHALRLLSAVRADAILLDLVMPEMDGFEVLRRIKQDAALRKIPVLVITAKDLTNVESDLLKRQVRACFQKNGAWQSDLLSEVRKALSYPELARSARQA